MDNLNAFATPEYPVLFTVHTDGQGDPPVPPGHAGISLALLVKGVPSFLATHLVPEEELDRVVTSLEGGDVRVAVVGLRMQIGEQEAPLTAEPRPAAFVSLVCADGLRLTLARIVSQDPRVSPERLARHVVKEIARGVQMPDLARAG